MSTINNKKREAVYKDQHGRLIRFDGFKLTALTPMNSNNMIRTKTNSSANSLAKTSSSPSSSSLLKNIERKQSLLRRPSQTHLDKKGVGMMNNNSNKKSNENGQNRLNTSNIFSKSFWTGKKGNGEFDFSNLKPPTLLNQTRNRSKTQSCGMNHLENFRNPSKMLPLPPKRRTTTGHSSALSSSCSNNNYVELNPCMFFNSLDPNQSQTKFIPISNARKSDVIYVDANGNRFWTFLPDYNGYVPFMNLVGTVDPQTIAPDCCVIDQHYDYSSEKVHALDCILFAGKDPNYCMKQDIIQKQNNDKLSLFSHPISKSKNNTVFVGIDGSQWRLNAEDKSVNNYFHTNVFVKLADPPILQSDSERVIQDGINKILENVLLTKSDLDVPIVTVSNTSDPNSKDALFFPPDGIENTNNQYVVSDTTQVFIYDGIEYVPL